MSELRRMWANTGYSADVDYLIEVGRVAARSNAVLECGTGVTTLALGALGVPTWSLEHDVEWAASIRSALKAIRSTSVRVLHVPLVQHDDVEWYRVPHELPDSFDVVVCDGPPGTTRGGRAGLWTLLGDRIASATVLLDDAQRPAEKALVRRLELDGWSSQVRGGDGGRQHAILNRTVGSSRWSTDQP